MLKKIRFTSEYLLAYLKKNIIFVLIGTIISSTIFLQRQTVRVFFSNLIQTEKFVGVEGLYNTGNLPTEITELMSFGLTVSENNRIVASPIVKTIEGSNNDKTYTFTLKEPIYWHNHKLLTSYDINPHLNGISIEPKKSDVLIINLNESFSPLLNSLTKPLFLNKTLIGLGEYVQTSATFQDGYFKTLKIKSQKTGQKINYRFYPNENDLNSAYKLGEIDEFTTNTLSPELSTWPRTKITPKISTSRYVAIFLNTEKINNKQTRQGLAYATPKTDDKNERAIGPISPDSWAYNSQIKEYRLNTTRAKELFEKTPITKLKLVVTDRRLLELAEEIKQYWSNILKIEVDVSTSTTSDYDALLTYAPIPKDPDQYLFWHSTQTKTNPSKLNNSRIDKLLEEGRQIYDLQERRNIYFDFQKFLLEEAPAIFIKFPTTFTVSRIK